MRTHRFQLGQETLEVTLTPLPDGRMSARVQRIVRAAAGAPERRSERVMEFDARRLGDAHYLTRLATGESQEVRMEREPGGGVGRVVRFGPEHALLEWIDPFAVSAVGRGGVQTGPRKISSPIPGRVVSIAVAVGEEVGAGQSIVVVEAMKMANELRTPIAGRVKSISTTLGDKVEAGMALAVIEPLATVTAPT